MKKKQLKVGVIGLGIGRHHIQGYQQHPAARVVALCDTDKDRLAEIGKQFGVKKHYTDAAEMLAAEKLDVCSVCTPNCFHAPLTLAALKAGCHVLCEKPMAMNAVEGAEMVDLAAKKRKRLMINFSYRFNPHSFALKAQVDTGVLGNVYYGRTVWHRRRGLPKFGGWFSNKAMAGGGPLIDLGVHRLDLALWLMGYPDPDWAVGGAYDYLATRIAEEEKKHCSVEDMAVGMIHFKNGAMLEIEASWASNRREGEYMLTRLYGTEGGLVQHNMNETYEFTAELLTKEPGGLFTKQIKQCQVNVPNAMYHFIDSIVNDVPNIATGEEGLKVMKILDAIYKSAETGKPVEIA